MADLNGTETLGRRIARLRLAHGMTQEHLAGLMHVSPQAVSKWENDQSAPDIALLVPLAQTLGLSVDELLGVTEAASPAAEEPAVEQPTAAVGAQGERGIALAAPEAAWAGDGTASGADAREGANGALRPPAALHIRVIELGGEDRVNVSIPLTFLRAIRGMAGVLPVEVGGVLEGLDLDAILAAASTAGTLVDVDDGEDRVIISLE